VLDGSVEPGDKVAVDAKGDGLTFDVESGGASDLTEATRRAKGRGEHRLRPVRVAV
jgi:hypothetical protein